MGIQEQIQNLIDEVSRVEQATALARAENAELVPALKKITKLVNIIGDDNALVAVLASISVIQNQLIEMVAANDTIIDGAKLKVKQINKAILALQDLEQ